MAAVKYDQKNPFMAKLVERRKLTGSNSTKETQHFVVDISGSGMTYASGDSLGVIPENNPEHVQELVSALKWSPEMPVILPKTEQTVMVFDALLKNFSLTHITKNFLIWFKDYLQDDTQKEKLDDLLKEENVSRLSEYCASHHLIDLVEEYNSIQCEPQSFIEKLRRLVPRLYSIASSPCVYPHEVHLTVAVVRYTMHGRSRAGIASSYLADRLQLNHSCMPVFVTHSKFKLPEDDHADIIMVGPGTGIAPFRAFIQERIAKKSTGRMWLFFGERQRSCDYLYGEEIDDYHQKGLLTRLSLAFSRDQDHKIYVQDKMREEAEALWEWIQRGAYFYVCGDAARMAKDVDLALHRIVQEQRGMDEAAAADYIKTLKKENRYQRDVY